METTNFETKKRGRPVVGTKPLIQVSIENDIMEWLRTIADESGDSISTVARKALRREMLTSTRLRD